MSGELIDERVVEMRFDNKDFEANVDQSIKTINNLKKSLDFEDAGESFENISKAASKCDMAPLEQSLEQITVKFNMLEMVAANVLGRIVNQAIDAGARLVKSLSTDQIAAGWSKYEQKTQSVQTIMAATGQSIDVVNDRLEKLVWFADETSYSFVDMVNNIGKFTSAGVDLDVAVDSMMGISNWAALSGAGIQQASRAMYNLSQAMGMGYVGVQDWKSIELANMATLEFKQTVIDTAVELGELRENADGTITTLKGTEVTAENMRETLKQKWFTGDVLNTALAEYNEFANAVYEFQEQWEEDHGEWIPVTRAMKMMRELGYEMDSLGAKAFMKAQEAITFTQAIEATTDAVSSGWMRTFEIIFGNYEKSKKLWTSLANDLWDIFAGGDERRNEKLSDLLDSSYQKMLNDMPDGTEMNDRLSKKIYEIAKNNKGEEYAKALFAEYDSVEAILQTGAFHDSTLEKIFSEVSAGFTKDADTSAKLLDDLKKSRLTLKQAAIRLASNQYGADIETQRKNVEALGFDYEYLSELADNWKAGYNVPWDQYQKELEESLEEQVKTYRQFAKEIGEIDIFEMMNLGGRDKLIGGFQNILKTVKNAILIFREFKNGIADLSGGESFLSKIIDGFYTLTSILAITDEKFEEIQETIYDFFHGGVQKKLTEFFKGKDVHMGTRWSEELNSYIPYYEHIPGLIDRITSIYTDHLKNLPSNISGTIEKVRTTVFGFFGSVPDKVKELKEKIFGEIKVKSFTNLLTGETRKEYEIVGGIIGNLKDKFQEFREGLGGKIFDGLVKAFEKIANFLLGYEKDGEHIKGAVEFVYDKVTALWERLKDIGKWIVDTFNNLNTKYGFIDSIKEGLQSVYDSAPFKAIRSLFGGEESAGPDGKNIKGSFKRQFSFSDALSNGKELISVGKDNAVNFLTKIKDKFNEIVKNAGYQSVKEFFLGNKEFGKDNIIIRIINYIRDKFNELKAKYPWIQSICDWIEKEIEKIKGLFINAGDSFGDGLKKVKEYLFGYDVKKSGLAGFFGQMEHVDGLLDKLKKSISSFMDFIIPGRKKGLVQMISDIIIGPGNTAQKVLRTIEVFFLSLFGITAGLLGFNFKGLGFEVKSPFAGLIDIVREFAISIAIMVGTFIAIQVAVKKLDMSWVDIANGLALIAVIMGALIACARLLDAGTDYDSLKDIVAQTVTTIPMLKTLAVILAEIMGFAIVFVGLTKLVGTQAVHDGVLAVGQILIAIGGLIFLLYLPDILTRNSTNKLKSKAGDLIGISFVLMMLVPVLLTYGALLAELAVIGKLVGKDEATVTFIQVMMGMILATLIAIISVMSFAKGGISKSAVFSLAIVSAIILEIGLVISSIAVITKLCGGWSTFGAWGAIASLLLIVFGFLAGLKYLLSEKGGIDSSVIVALAAVVAVIHVIGKTIETITKIIQNAGADRVTGAFVAIIIGFIGIFGAIKWLSNTTLTIAQVTNCIAMMAMIGLFALEVWGLMVIAKKANINSWDSLVPMLEAIGELAASMIILSIVIGVLGFIGNIIAPLFGAAVMTVLAVTAGVIVLGAAFIAMNKAIKWMEENLFGGGDSMTDSVDNVMEFMAAIMHGLGEMLGALIGGFGEGLTDSLPAIGTNISDFATKLKPFLDIIEKLTDDHSKGAGIFVNVLLSLIADTFLAGIASFIERFTGDISTSATNLSSFITNLQPFLNNVSTITKDHLTGAKFLTKIMKEIVKQDVLNAIDNGIKKYFTGEINYKTYTDNLNTIATGIVTMDQTLSAVDKGKIDNDISIIKAVLDLVTDSNYKQGGFAGILDSVINGTIDFETLFTKLNSQIAEGFVTFCDKVKDANIDNAKKAVTVLPLIMDLVVDSNYKQGGIAGALDFLANGTTNFEGLFQKLNDQIAEGFITFCDKVKDANIENAKKAAEVLPLIMDLVNDNNYKEGGIAGALDFLANGTTNFEGLFKKLNDQIATGFVTFCDKVKDANVENAKKASEVLPLIMDLVLDSNYRQGGIAGILDILATGTTNFTSLFTKLNNQIATGFVTFCDKVKDANIENAKKAAEVLPLIMDLVVDSNYKQGGIAGILDILANGNTNFEGLFKKLNDEIATGFVTFCDKVKDANVDNAKKAAEVLPLIMDLVNDSNYKQGGIAGIFDKLVSGSTNFTELFKKLNTDIVSGFSTFCLEVADVNVDNAKKAAEILPSIMDMLTNKNYRSGGISGFFTDLLQGDANYAEMFTALNTKILPGLRDFAKGINELDDEGNAIDYSGVANAAEAMKALMDLMSMDASNLINDDESKFLWFKVDVSDATKVKDSLKVIQDIVVPAISSLQEALSANEVDADYMRDTVGIFSNLIQTLTDFSNLGLTEDDVKNIGSYIITGLIAALDEGCNSVKEAAQRVANNIKTGLTLTLKIESPSKVAYKIGEFVSQGLINGINAGDDKAYRTAQMLGLNVKRGLNDALSQHEINMAAYNLVDENLFNMPDFTMVDRWGREIVDIEKMSKFMHENFDEVLDSSIIDAFVGDYQKSINALPKIIKDADYAAVMADIASGDYGLGQDAIIEALTEELGTVEAANDAWTDYNDILEGNLKIEKDLLKMKKQNPPMTEEEWAAMWEKTQEGYDKGYSGEFLELAKKNGTTWQEEAKKQGYDPELIQEMYNQRWAADWSGEFNEEAIRIRAEKELEQELNDIIDEAIRKHELEKAAIEEKSKAIEENNKGLEEWKKNNSETKAARGKEYFADEAEGLVEEYNEYSSAAKRELRALQKQKEKDLEEWKKYGAETRGKNYFVDEAEGLVEEYNDRYTVGTKLELRALQKQKEAKEKDFEEWKTIGAETRGKSYFADEAEGLVEEYDDWYTVGTKLDLRVLQRQQQQQEELHELLVEGEVKADEDLVEASNKVSQAIDEVTESNENKNEVLSQEPAKIDAVTEAETKAAAAAGKYAEQLNYKTWNDALEKVRTGVGKLTEEEKKMLDIGRQATVTEGYFGESNWNQGWEKAMIAKGLTGANAEVAAQYASSGKKIDDFTFKAREATTTVDELGNKTATTVEENEDFINSLDDTGKALYNYYKYGFSKENLKKNGKFTFDYNSALAAAEKAGDESAVAYIKGLQDKADKLGFDVGSEEMFKKLGIEGINEFVSGDFASKIAEELVKSLGDQDILGELGDSLGGILDSDIFDQLTNNGGILGTIFGSVLESIKGVEKTEKEVSNTDTKVNMDNSDVAETISMFDVLSEQYKLTENEKKLAKLGSENLQKGEKVSEAQAKALQKVWDGVMLGMYESGEDRIQMLKNLGVDWETLFGISGPNGGIDWSNYTSSAMEYSKVVQGLGDAYTTNDLFNDIKNGKWGMGSDRVKALEAAGYDAQKIQEAFAQWSKDPDSVKLPEHYGKITDEERDLAEQTEKLNEVLNTTPEGAFRTIADFLEGVSKVIENGTAADNFNKFMDSVTGSLKEVKLENASDLEKVANFLMAIRKTANESSGITKDFGQFVKDIKDSLNGLGEIKIENTEGMTQVTDFLNGIEITNKENLDAATSFINTINSFVSGEDHTGAISNSVTKMMEDINSMPEISTEKTQPLVDFLNNLMAAEEAITNSSVMATIASLAVSIITVFEGKYQDFTTVGHNLIIQLIMGMLAERQTAMLAGGSIAGSILTGFKDQGTDKAAQTGKDFMKEFSQGITDSVTAIAEDDSDDGVKAVIDQMKDLLSGIVPDGGALASNMIDGIVQGIIAGADKVKAVMAWLAAGAEGEFKYEIQAASPSKKFIKYAGWMTEGIVIGIREGSSDVFNEMGGVATGTLDKFSSIISNISDVVESELNTDPVIRPVVDMSEVYDSAKNIDAALSTEKAVGISTAENMNKNGIFGPDGQPSNGNYTFVQNNYSPKALSKLEIYRQTKNQFAMLKGANV